jgi:hypothetical protein
VIMSSKTPSVQNITSTTQLPDWVSQAGQQNVQQAQTIAQQPWTGYGGPVVSAWTPDMLNAAQGVRNAQGAADPLLNTAAGQQASIATQEGPRNVQSFMNPNMQAVIDEINRQAGIQSAGATRQAAARRALGSTSDAVMQGQIQQGAQRAVADTANTAYNQALQASMGQQQLDLFGASGLAGTAQLGQGLRYQDINALMGVGQGQRQDAQTLINQAMQNFYEQRDWPVRGLNLQTAALSQTPYDVTRTQQQPYYPPSVGGAALGGAVAGGSLGYQISGSPYGGAAGALLGGLSGFL